MQDCSNLSQDSESGLAESTTACSNVGEASLPCTPICHAKGIVVTLPGFETAKGMLGKIAMRRHRFSCGYRDLPDPTAKLKLEWDCFHNT
jgi:hypothetical protein